MRKIIDPHKVQFFIHAQLAYQLLLLLLRPLSRTILEVLQQYPAFQLDNIALVILVNRLGQHDKMICQSEVSQILALLKRRGIIITERRGKHIHYAIDSDRLARIQGAIHRFTHPQPIQQSSKTSNHVTTTSDFLSQPTPATHL